MTVHCASASGPIPRMKAEEKGAMLNLVCQLVRDAFSNAFDVSVIVTNDADPIEPIVRMLVFPPPDRIMRV